jgi:sulfide dehydrogenase cytochrome subunit
MINFSTSFAQIFILSVTLTTICQAQPQEMTNLNRAALAATCASCHGTNGNGVPNTGVPIISLQSAQQILDKLQRYKTGELTGTIMPQIAKGYSDEQLQFIAQYLGKQ